MKNRTFIQFLKSRWECLVLLVGVLFSLAIVWLGILLEPNVVETSSASQPALVRKPMNSPTACDFLSDAEREKREMTSNPFFIPIKVPVTAAPSNAKRPAVNQPVKPKPRPAPNPEAERAAREKAAREKAARERAEAERKRKAAEKAANQRKQAEAKAKAEAEKQARLKAEAAAKAAREKAEADRKNAEKQNQTMAKAPEAQPEKNDNNTPKTPPKPKKKPVKATMKFMMRQDRKDGTQGAVVALAIDGQEEDMAQLFSDKSKYGIQILEVTDRDITFKDARAKKTITLDLNEEGIIWVLKG